MSCSCGGGLNQVVSLPVPGSDQQDGEPVDVSGLVACKSIEISGTYEGTYVIMGSHDGVNFVPVTFFSSGAGAQAWKQTTRVTLRSMRVRRRAQNFPGQTIAVSIGSQAVCTC